MDPVAALEREMLKYSTHEPYGPDSLDREKLGQAKFKASFISHIGVVKSKHQEYEARL